MNVDERNKTADTIVCASTEFSTKTPGGSTFNVETASFYFVQGSLHHNDNI